MRSMITLTFAGSLLLAGAALAQPMGVKPNGGALTDPKGMTLYTYDKDTTPGKSACNGPCLAAWPALVATSDAKPTGDWTVVTRDDGGKQWAYKGKPLYTFAKDANAGDKTGDGRGQVWHVAAP
jgi:predicted lipoprotein with Yx(FWY)xxD motif